MEKRLATEKRSIYVKVYGLVEPATIANNQTNDVGWTIVKCDDAETGKELPCALTTTHDRAQFFSARCFMINEETMIVQPIITKNGEYRGKEVTFNTAENPNRFFEIAVTYVPKPTADAVYCYADKDGNLHPYKAQANEDKNGNLVVDAKAKDLYILDAVKSELSAKEFYVPIQSIVNRREQVTENAQIEKFKRRYNRLPDWENEDDLKKLSYC